MNPASIESLLPHRDPFLFVDEIISVSKEEIVASKVFDDNNAWLKGSFAKPVCHYVPATIVLESMAQSGGAGLRLLSGFGDGVFGLVNIDSARFHQSIKFDTPVRYVIRNIRVSGKIIRQSGIAYVDDIPAVEASWMCVRMD